MSGEEGRSPEGGQEKLAATSEVIGELLRLMEVPARLELKDAPPSPLDKGGPGIAVAVHLEGELPGVSAGKRSSFSDALQFLANKIVNRAGTEKRWILVGVGGFPEPRQAPPPKGPQQASPAPGAPASGGAQPGRTPAGAGGPVAPAAGTAAGPPPAGRPSPSPGGAAPAAQGRGGQARGKGGGAPAVDEATLAVPPDEASAALGAELAQKSAAHGRFYAVVGLGVEDRARMLQAARKVEGASAKVEGEGKARRLVLVPDKPVPMPKWEFPDYDDEDEGED